MSCQDGCREAVARDGERSERPRRVHERHVTARMAALPHDQRGADRPDAPGREDEPEVAGRGVQLILHEVRQQHLGRAHEGEIGDRRGEEGAPQPDPAPDELEALLHGAEGRVDMFRSRMCRGSHQEHRDGGDDEGRGVDCERGTQADTGHERSSQRRPRETIRDRPDQLVERVGRREVGRRDDVRHDRLEGGCEEGGADAVESDDDQEFPEGEEAGQGEDGEGGDDDRACEVGAQHERAPVEPVAEDPRRQQEGDHRDGHADPEERERGRGVPELVGLPGHRHEEDAVPEEGDGHAGPEETKVPVAERREEVYPGEATRAVERLVAMLHTVAARRPLPRRRRGNRRAPRGSSAWRTGSPGRARSRDHEATAICSGSSIPSATTSRLRLFPRATIAAARLDSSCSDERKERSILRMSTGKRLR